VDSTVLVLKDEDVADLLSTADYLEAMEIAFTELGHGRAVSRTRTDCSVLQRSQDVSLVSDTFHSKISWLGSALRFSVIAESVRS
jgi:ornithine cyclodeaminase/alanine dehydrogenase-like protein (mu-crystallin family)